MRDALNILLDSYQSKGILVDTNILLLLIVGLADRSRISDHKRTKEFTHEDFDILVQILDQFKIRVTLPNIMTEAINLARQTSDDLKTSCCAYVESLFDHFTEDYIESSKLASLEEFITLGLTDAAILESARDQYLVLTDDFKLAGTLTKAGVDVINFNHLRPYF